VSTIAFFSGISSPTSDWSVICDVIVGAAIDSEGGGKGRFIAIDKRIRDRPDIN
jgi:hypothetical protein